MGVTQFATAKAGLILVNINPAYRLSELEYALNKVGCKALVTATAFKTSDYIGMLSTLGAGAGASRAGRALRRAAAAAARRDPDRRSAAPGTIPFDDVAARGGEAERAGSRELASKLQFDDAINIQFTSGTTGSPKGATLTHHNILNNGYFVGEAHAADATATGSASRCRSTTASAWCWATSPASPTARPWSTRRRRFDPLAVLEAVQQSAAPRSTACRPCSSPSSTIRSSHASTSASLRTGIMAGSPCPIEVMKRVVEQMHMREVTIAYGMTETSPVSFQSAADDPLERRVSTVGRIHPHLEVKIVDAEGRIVPRGESGELCTRGYSVMLGYWDDPEKTARGHRRRTAGCTPATSPRSTPRATATSSAASRTWSSAAARTSTRARSRSSSTATRRSRTSRSSACPTRSTARSSAPGSSSARARR